MGSGGGAELDGKRGSGRVEMEGWMSVFMTSVLQCQEVCDVLCVCNHSSHVQTQLFLWHRLHGYHCMPPWLGPSPVPPQAHAKLQVDHEVLGEELQQLQCRSEDIIATLQKERDRAIAECEEQRSQVGRLVWEGLGPAQPRPPLLPCVPSPGPK